MKTNRVLSVKMESIKRDYHAISRAIQSHYKVKCYNYSELQEKLRNASYNVPVIIMDTRKKSK